jgi:hypothetical protein
MGAGKKHVTSHQLQTSVIVLVRREVADDSVVSLLGADEGQRRE